MPMANKKIANYVTLIILRYPIE